jgi:hypothetical protein
MKGWLIFNGELRMKFRYFKYSAWTSKWIFGSLALSGVLCLTLISCIGLQKKDSYEARKMASEAAHQDLYVDKIQPLFDNRCVACHSCFNSPCQLNLTSFAGLDRGAIKDDLYDFKTIGSRNPTRLGIDVPQVYVAETVTSEWRKPQYGSGNDTGFFPVVNRTAADPEERLKDSILAQMISLRQGYLLNNPEVSQRWKSFAAEDPRVCPINEEMPEFVKNKSWSGMPYGFPELNSEEKELIFDWVKKGSPGPDQNYAVESLRTVFPNNVELPESIETFLNGADYAHKITARYIYEHLFIAHIYFDEMPGSFYRLIRASCSKATGLCVELSTRRPTDDPTTSPYYRDNASEVIRYKFQKVVETIVHKSHIPYHMTSEKLTKWKKMFVDEINRNVSQQEAFPDYGDQAGGSPFYTFRAIPAKSRYQFLLDDSYFFVMSFIKGPVCRGTGALSVIDDHFWVFFLNPDSDMTIKHPEYFDENKEELFTPAYDANTWTVAQLFYQRRRDARMAKKKLYDENLKPGHGFELSDVWNGNSGPSGNANEFSANAALTVYRHQDSASVSRGAIGETPKTMWMVDYPIFEDIYYNLVASYDVFSPQVHSLKTRLHMDASRFNAQDMYLSFLPKSRRNGKLKTDKNSIRASWTYDKFPNKKIPSCKILPDELCAFYRKSAGTMREEVYPYAGSEVETNILFKDKKHPQNELAAEIIKYLQKNITEDVSENLNKYFEGAGTRELSDIEKTFATTFAGQKGVSFMPELSYVRVFEDGDPESAGQWYSFIHNKERYNVAFVDALVPDEEILRPEDDSVNVVKGFVGSYANAIFNVPISRVKEFSNDILKLKNKETLTEFYKKYLVSRHNPNFWNYYDKMISQAKRDGITPVSDKHEGSVIDLNRYINDEG